MSELGPEEKLEQEAVARELAEELRKLRVEDVLVNTLVHVSSIGYRRLGLTEDSAAERDLPQTALAIETLRALIPVLEDFLPRDLVASFEEPLRDAEAALSGAAAAVDEVQSQWLVQPLASRVDVDRQRRHGRYGGPSTGPPKPPRSSRPRATRGTPR